MKNFNHARGLNLPVKLVRPNFMFILQFLKTEISQKSVSVVKNVTYGLAKKVHHGVKNTLVLMLGKKIPCGKEMLLKIQNGRVDNEQEVNLSKGFLARFVEVLIPKDIIRMVTN
jgi:hypothetical protein